ncbi:MAG TPA: dihydrofolate reductase family protein, partial [Thermoplasmata archaeon]|nr:dihydrofolate reductase family protein [Thermoplasmata archaeon]
RASPRHRWTAERAAPALADRFRALRTRLHLEGAPLNVVVTASGRLDLTLPLFRSGEVPVLVVTTPPGARRLSSARLPPGIRIATASNGPSIPAPAILRAVARVRSCGTVLVEGGPHLLARFVSDRCLDELFLTVAPRLIGRDRVRRRLSLIEGRVSGDGGSLDARLWSVRRGGELLFLRYGLPRR